MIKYERIINSSNLSVYGCCMQQDEAKLDPEIKEKLDEVGFTFYLILARIYDLDPKMAKSDGMSPTLKVTNYNGRS